MRRALVTGGAGFIGSHLCEALLARGWEVTCLDNFSTGSRENVTRLAGLDVVEGDANSWRVLRAVCRQSFDVLYHYAAVVGVRQTEEEPLSVLADVEGLRHVARAARAGLVKKVVFASSSEVYGDTGVLPMDEAAGVVGWSPYTTVKLYGEYLLAALWQEHRIPTVSLRFFNVYGSRQRGSAYGFVTAQFLEQVQAGEAPTVFGNGQQTRDFVHISDNVAAALAVVDSKAAWGQALNVGSGVETRVVDLADMVIRVAGPDGLAPAFLPARVVEISRRCAGTAKMAELVGWHCRVSLVDGLAHLAGTGHLASPMDGVGEVAVAAASS